MSVKHFLILVVSTFLLTSCSSTKDDLRKVINEHLENKELYVSLGGALNRVEALFPHTIEKGAFDNYEEKLKEFSVLENVGLVTIEDTTFKKEKSVLASMGSNDDYYEVNTKRIELTKLGKKYLADSNNPILKVMGFNFGIMQVNKIIKYTKPATMNGRKVTTVTFNMSAEKIFAWAKNKSVIKKFSKIKKYIDTKENPIKNQATLVLTNEGWNYPE